jgi:hypothetical protein
METRAVAANLRRQQSLLSRPNRGRLELERNQLLHQEGNGDFYQMKEHVIAFIITRTML